MSVVMATARENTVCTLTKCVISLVEVALVRPPPTPPSLFIELVCVKFEFEVISCH